jgi:poly(3-hydroxybutyrate) depolymerase
MPSPLLIALLLILAWPLAGQTPTKAAGDAMRLAWSGDDLDAVVEAAEGLAFADLYRAVSSGPSYPAVPAGVSVRYWTDDRGVEFRYAVMVPPGYDPGHPYPVHVYLHGGIMRPLSQRGDRWWSDDSRMIDSTRIAVFPLGWDEATWWGPHQAAHLAAISRALRQEFNVDENRFFLVGISDGGTGVYFHAFRESTIWAGFLAYIGHPAVLNNPRADTDGELFVTNVTNRPLFIVSGEVDRLYPSAVVAPYVERFRAAGVEVVFRPQAGGGHDMRWLPNEVGTIRAFLESHPRDPLPDTIAWETERTDRYQRHHWLIITQLGAVPGETPLSAQELFQHRERSGRVDIARRDNRFVARTRGVRRFRLLLSPEEIDFSRELTVEVNGVVAFQGMVRPDPVTLLSWAMQDRDRSMPFGAELDIEVPEQP